jgi:hypothetical protein
MRNAETPNEMLDAISTISNNLPQYNPLRIDSRRTSYKTAGQIVIVPKERLLQYRPIWCELMFDLDSLNHPENKTFFEVISQRKILPFKKREVEI